MQDSDVDVTIWRDGVGVGGILQGFLWLWDHMEKMSCLKCWVFFNTFPYRCEVNWFIYQDNHIFLNTCKHCEKIRYGAGNMKGKLLCRKRSFYYSLLMTKILQYLVHCTCRKIGSRMVS